MKQYDSLNNNILWNNQWLHFTDKYPYIYIITRLYQWLYYRVFICSMFIYAYLRFIHWLVSPLTWPRLSANMSGTHALASSSRSSRSSFTLYLASHYTTYQISRKIYVYNSMSYNKLIYLHYIIHLATIPCRLDWRWTVVSYGYKIKTSVPSCCELRL